MDLFLQSVKGRAGCAIGCSQHGRSGTVHKTHIRERKLAQKRTRLCLLSVFLRLLWSDSRFLVQRRGERETFTTSSRPGNRGCCPTDTWRPRTPCADPGSPSLPRFRPSSSASQGSRSWSRGGYTYPGLRTFCRCAVCRRQPDSDARSGGTSAPAVLPSRYQSSLPGDALI